MDSGDPSLQKARSATANGTAARHLGAHESQLTMMISALLFLALLVGCSSSESHFGLKVGDRVKISDGSQVYEVTAVGADWFEIDGRRLNAGQFQGGIRVLSD